ncbi:hypothetical protein Lal_00031615, partial [Lupinus albus]
MSLMERADRQDKSLKVDPTNEGVRLTGVGNSVLGRPVMFIHKNGFATPLIKWLKFIARSLCMISKLPINTSKPIRICCLKA